MKVKRLKKPVTIIIVDCQYDFVKGNMAVKDADKAISNIVKYILKYKRDVDKIVFTADWHPYNHCSFKKFGGQWPVHCVQYSKGASIEEFLFNTVTASGIPYDTVLKGTHKDIEEYGAFRIPSFSDCLFDEYHECPINPNTDIIVCGIAGDYCVKDTIKNLLGLNPKVYLEGIASIDDGSTIKSIIDKYHLEVVTLDKIKKK